jgi:hypothetical protein
MHVGALGVVMDMQWRIAVGGRGRRRGGIMALTAS